MVCRRAARAPLDSRYSLRQRAEPDARRVIGGAVSAVGRFGEVFWLGEINIGDELLRVAVHQREPGALDLHHQAVILLEAVQDVEELDLDLRRLARLERLRLLEAVAV